MIFKGKRSWSAFIWAGALAFFMAFIPFMMESLSLPSEVRLLPGQDYSLKTFFPYKATLESSSEVISLKGTTLKDELVVQASDSSGKAEISLSFLGIPFRQMQVKVLPEINLVPGGHSIGVAMYTRGALVAGTSELTDADGVKHHPAKEAGLEPGDVIESVNGVDIENAAHLTELINEGAGNPLELTVIRDDVRRSMTINPIYDARDKVYRLGIWVRDSTAGVGTLTYYDQSSGRYGALGHGIADADTGKYLSVREGEILHSKIYDVKAGKNGQPGELHGNFIEGEAAIGDIQRNDVFGLYGDCYEPVINPLYDRLPIGTQGSAHVGKASILCTVDEKGISEYKCEIVSIQSQPQPSAKGMVVRITDERLLAKTGGIVQGMSGSPIIQDGHIIGAVTHVFVNDPTRGYGIFIEWMIDDENIE